MLDKAIQKITSEMNQSNNNPYVQVVGEYLLHHLSDNPEDAEKLAVEGKTIAKSLDEMRKMAEKKKVGNCAMFTPQEGFEIVMKYFGIEPKGVNSMVTGPVIAAEDKTVKEQTPKVNGTDFNVSLEDLL